MKISKKILACLLSIALVMSFAIIPTAVSAEETVSKYISLLDLTDVATTENSTSLPAALSEMGYATYADGWNTGHAFNGTQAIAQVGANKAWEINFSGITASGSGNYCDISNEFMVKIAVPAKYIPYVSAVTLKADTNTTFSYRYCFGVSDGGNYGKPNNGPWNNASGAINDNLTVAGLGKRDAWASFDGNAATDVKWADTQVKYLFINLAAPTTAVADAKLYINDLGITISGDADTLNAIPNSYKESILDLSSCEVGPITSAEYPKALADAGSGYTGTQSIVEVSGKKALQIDTSTMTGSGSDKFSEGGYNQAFGLSVKIPSYLIPFITGISYKFNKDMSGQMCGYFSVTDGTNYGKPGDFNQTVAAGATGPVVVTIDPNSMNKVEGWYFGNYGGSGNAKFNKDYTKAFIYFGATNNTGSVTLTDIQIDYTCTDGELNAALAEFNANKAKLADFEASGNETGFAASGAKAKAVSNANWNTPGAVLDLSNNEYVAEANGFTFWTYSEAGKSVMMTIAGNGKEYTMRTDVTAGYQKHFIAFSDLCLKSGDNFSWGCGVNANLTTADIAGLTTVRFLDLNQSGAIIYYDDFYLNFDKTGKTTGAIELTADNVTGASSVENGVATFVGGASYVANIAVPVGTLTTATDLYWNCTASAGATAKVIAYAKSGTDTYIKRGENTWGLSLAAGATGTGSIGFNNTNSGGDSVYTFNGTWYLSNWTPSSARIAPTAAQKAAINTVSIKLDLTSVAATESVTLNSVTFNAQGMDITAGTFENGSVSLMANNAYPGTEAGFVVKADENTKLNGVSVTTAGGSTVVATANGGKDGQNVPGYYTFTMPEDAVTVSADIAVKKIEGASVTAGTDLTMNYYATADQDASMTFTIGNDDPIDAVGTLDAQTGMYKFTFANIAPGRMGENIKAELKVDGQVISTNNTTVKAYCENLLAKTAADLQISEDKADKLHTFVKDMLRYGSAAQTYFNYNTDALVDADVEGGTTFVAPETTAKNTENKSADGVTFNGQNLWFDNVNQLMFRFKLDGVDAQNVEIQISNGSDVKTVTAADFEANGDSYIAYSDDIFATEFDDVFTATAYVNGVAGASVQYSVNSYVYVVCHRAGVSAEMQKLVEATYNYGLAATAYAAAN